MSEQFVKIRPSLTRPIQWTMIFDGHTGTEGNYPPVDLPKDTGAHLITFTIDNPEGMEIEFSNDPIWIQQGEFCPTTRVVDGKQIKSKTKLNSTQLVIKDINKGKQQILTYRLNFVDGDDPSHQVTPLDPQIKNGGGTGPGQGFVVEARQGLLALGILVAGFITYRLLVDR